MFFFPETLYFSYTVCYCTPFSYVCPYCSFVTTEVVSVCYQIVAELRISTTDTGCVCWVSTGSKKTAQENGLMWRTYHTHLGIRNLFGNSSIIITMLPVYIVIIVRTATVLKTWVFDPLEDSWRQHFARTTTSRNENYSLLTTQEYVNDEQDTKRDLGASCVSS